MNKSFKIFGWTLLILAFFQTSCDKIEKPIKPAVELDTTIYPGNWDDYPEPVWMQNVNTNRNLVLEDYTGHKCPNCPDAATEAQNIELANPNRVFVASIHAAPGGVSAFQAIAADCGQPSNPNDKYCTKHYCDESIAYGNAFQSGFGFFANPMGNISRITPSGENMFELYGNWSSRVTNVLAANDLKVNIQAQSNYYSAANGFYLHTEIEFLEDLTGSYSTVVYLLEEKIVDWQDVNGTADSLYEHHNVFVGCIDGLAWGRSISGGTSTGDKTYFDYSYTLPSGKDNTDYHLLIYVYDVATYEILQVIKHEI
ncbi:MAG: Omp28-related outer membrane protein [Crocinitomicaceae bacterium]|nr:Omp28-related outer membrane protein [Crocinitomicaceae bacterium]